MMNEAAVFAMVAVVFLLCLCALKNLARGGNRSFTSPGVHSDQADKTDEEMAEEVRKRVANDLSAMCLLAGNYHCGVRGVQQDQMKAIELWSRAADLGNTKAHNNLADIYDEEGDLKKAKFHYEAAAMAGCEDARYNIGSIEGNSGNNCGISWRLCVNVT
jgi:TPR repeat protein